MGLRKIIKQLIPEQVRKSWWRMHYYYLAHTPGYANKIYSVTLETTNVCDIQCEVCPVPKLDRKKGFMNLEDFKTILDKLPNTVKTVRMNYAGEPLLNKNIFKMINYGKQKRPDIAFRVSTSGTQLDRFSPAEITGSGLDELDVCLDGPTKEIHEGYRRGSDFDRICDAARTLCQFKQKNGFSQPRIIQMTLMNKQTVKLIPQITALAQDVGFDELHLRYMGIPTLTCPLPVLQKLYPYYAGLSLQELDSFREKYLPDNEYTLYRYDGARYVLSKPMKRCYSFLSPVIYYNGDVSVCCHDGEGYCVFGNLIRESFAEVMKRQSVRDVYYKKLDICQDCDLSWSGVNYKEIKLK